MVTLTINYSDGNEPETIEAESVTFVHGCVAYVLPGEPVMHGIPIARIDNYVLRTRTKSTQLT